MNLIVDTNIYISALFWNGLPRNLLVRFIDNKDTVFISPDIITEIRTVLSRQKFKLDRQTIQYQVQQISDLAQMVFPSKDTKIIDICRDKDDNKFLLCAAECNADFLITGDQDLLVLKQYKSTKICTVHDYMENYTDEKNRHASKKQL